MPSPLLTEGLLMNGLGLSDFQPRLLADRFTLLPFNKCFPIKRPLDKISCIV